jgi:hypothetical protein
VEKDMHNLSFMPGKQPADQAIHPTMLHTPPRPADISLKTDNGQSFALFLNSASSSLNSPPRTKRQTGNRRKTNRRRWRPETGCRRGKSAHKDNTDTVRASGDDIPKEHTAVLAASAENTETRKPKEAAKRPPGRR